MESSTLIALLLGVTLIIILIVLAAYLRDAGNEQIGGLCGFTKGVIGC